MAEEVSVVVTNETIDVLAPPTSVTVSLGVGADGERGSIIRAGNKIPSEFYSDLGETPRVGDVYIYVAGHSVWQYVRTPSGTIWSNLFSIAELVDVVGEAKAARDEAAVVAAAIPRWWSGTQAAYTALGTYDPKTIYLITGA